MLIVWKFPKHIAGRIKCPRRPHAARVFENLVKMPACCLWKSSGNLHRVPGWYIAGIKMHLRLRKGAVLCSESTKLKSIAALWSTPQTLFLVSNECITALLFEKTKTVVRRSEAIVNKPVVLLQSPGTFQTHDRGVYLRQTIKMADQLCLKIV